MTSRSTAKRFPVLAKPILLEQADEAEYEVFVGEVISREQNQLGLFIRPLGSAAYATAQEQWDLLETLRGYGT